jgi:hypothetical protein
MMKTTLILSTIVLALVFTGCNKEEDPPMKVSSMFKVSIENVMDEKDFLSTGVFNTPAGATEPGGAGPGNMYTFSFEAGPGTKLSFATMFVASNDLYYAPSGKGIDLFSGSVALTGDITSQIMLFDAGTEVNEEPGAGPNQPMIGGPGVGMAEGGVVKEISMVNDGFTYPMVGENIMVWVDNDGATGFTVTIKNLEGSTTPIAPGVWVIHSMDNPLFEEGMADFESGLKGLAEDGNPSSLGGFLDMNSGYVSPLAPGAWAVHPSTTKPIFTNNTSDMGEGLENLAENGDPSTLAAALMAKTGVLSSGAFTTPTGSSGPGALMPGASYEFTFEAHEGDYLSFATMLVQTNDLFFSPTDMGIALFSGGSAVSGNITSKVMLYDAGTEPNELPGVGLHQPARLNGGTDEMGKVMIVNDEFTYPSVTNAVKITITPM